MIANSKQLIVANRALKASLIPNKYTGSFFPNFKPITELIG